jgi:lysyl-tRNA synthetase
VSSEPTPPQDAADEPIDAAEHARGLALERSRRLGQLDAMRNAGTNPYPYRFDRTHTLADIRSEFGALEAGTETEVHVEVAGRMLLKRDQGKLIFASLRDRDGDIQLFVSKAIVGDELFDAINALDLGDWVGVSGLVMTTRKGELSIKVNKLVLLAKAVRPLPDKWHGLTDPDTRYRQRYADLISNDEARRAFAIRHAIIASFRKTLSAKSFIEVETPVLHAEAGGAHARPFNTHHNALDMPLFLRIALELHLKRLIVGGMERVYEIGRVFRNEGISTRHNPEFTMMELYQAFGDYSDVMAITEELFVAAARDAIGTTIVDINGTATDFAEPFRRVRMIDLVAEKLALQFTRQWSVKSCVHLLKNTMCMCSHNGALAKLLKRCLKHLPNTNSWPQPLLLATLLKLAPSPVLTATTRSSLNALSCSLAAVNLPTVTASSMTLLNNACVLKTSKRPKKLATLKQAPLTKTICALSSSVCHQRAAWALVWIVSPCSLLACPPFATSFCSPHFALKFLNNTRKVFL